MVVAFSRDVEKLNCPIPGKRRSEQDQDTAAAAAAAAAVVVGNATAEPVDAAPVVPPSPVVAAVPVEEK